MELIKPKEKGITEMIEFPLLGEKLFRIQLYNLQI